MAPQPTMTQVLIDRGHQLQEEYANILAQRAANRRSLKDLDLQNLLTEEEQSAMDEMYPPRERKSEEERLAAAREQVSKLEQATQAEG